ncbi:hypothetical protein BDP55DRAFT_635507 [Colletotrichum godetiae]|uniref:Uncharacterized protein n=1 Tax=Colletotrichum godetiae TaxID=1209918 RepID=A0AAJ0ADF5_9PEZI|nr:uncharacterized protein BDP55DRAFT_635507 [Colletotrichum godetiae]KAK1671880.1 hypothetical protein BDP55DRAFT_635507 [Colletotrichum godetiae]
MSRQFRLSHLFPLFVAIAHTMGGIVPFVAKDAGIRSFGLPERFAESTIAQSCFILDGARLSVLGMVQLIMYLRGDYAAVDIIMALLVYVGLVDGCIYRVSIGEDDLPSRIDQVLLKYRADVKPRTQDIAKLVAEAPSSGDAGKSATSGIDGTLPMGQGKSNVARFLQNVLGATDAGARFPKLRESLSHAGQLHMEFASTKLGSWGTWSRKVPERSGLVKMLK